MRRDMAKVLVERPRLIDSVEHRGRMRPEEALPKAIGLRRDVREAGGFKQLNENLAPLRRYLERQVGRPWNKVFSEIAANLKSTSTVQQHVRDHIKDFVQLHPMDSARPWPGQDRRWFQPLYVDQRDGILKRTDRLAWARAIERRPAPSPQDDRLPHTGDIEFRCLGGLWFEVRLGRLPRPEYRAVTRRTQTPAWGRAKAKTREETVLQLVTPAVHDIVTGQAVTAGPELNTPQAWTEYRKVHPSPTYAIEKRQLSRSELRRHGLKNRSD